MTLKPAIIQGSPSHRAALIALGLAGVAVFLAMPVIAAGLAGELGYTAREVGVFSAVQLVGISLGCVLSVLAPRVEMRTAGMCALAVLLACDLLSLAAPGRLAFLGLRLIGGVAGGIAVAQATGGLARLRNSERDFGLFLAAQTLVAILVVYTLPELVGRYGFGASFLPLILVEIIAVALVWRYLPRGATATPPRSPAGGMAALGWIGSGGMLASILAFYVGVGALWTYLALLGQGAGLGPGQIAFAITVSKLVALGASFLPGLIGVRFGRLAPITACIAVLIVATLLFPVSASAASFTVAAGVFSLGWYVLHPFHLGALAQIDSDGRPILASAALTGAGLALGPAIVAAAPGQGASTISATAALAFAASGVFAAAALLLHRNFVARPVGVVP
jgi:predicted MFS family arabinose efflux permease